MALQKPMPGTVQVKRNCWKRGVGAYSVGAYSMRGELKRGISFNKRRLNRRIRHAAQQEGLRGSSYKRIIRSLNMVRFS